MPRVIPFGDRILVRRRKIGNKVGKGIIEIPDEVKNRPTDLADVIYTPEHSFADKELIDNANQIVNSMIGKAKDGNSDALISLLRFNEFLKIKTIKQGDAVMIGKYVGTDFHDNKGGENLTLVKGDDIIGRVEE